MRRLILVVAIVLAWACHPAALPSDMSPHAARHAAECCPASHRTPATHSPQGQHAQFQDTSRDATLTAQSWDRLPALDASTDIEREAGRFYRPDIHGFSPLNHTPRYLRTFVLLI